MTNGHGKPPEPAHGDSLYAPSLCDADAVSVMGAPVLGVAIVALHSGGGDGIEH